MASAPFQPPVGTLLKGLRTRPALPDDDPRNAVFPGLFKYGGAHVIEDLLNGKKVRLMAKNHGRWLLLSDN